MWLLRMHRVLSVIIIFLAGHTYAIAQTAVIPPDQLVQSVIQSVVNGAQYDRAIQAGDEERMVELINDNVSPHLDFERMTALAAGRLWPLATPAQKVRLIHEFRRLLIFTYSAVMMGYKTGTVIYVPFRSSPGDTDVTVRIKVNQSGKSEIPIDFSMELKGGEWKAYDVTIGGVSLVTNYRDTFKQEADRAGIDGLIAMLKQRNEDLERKVGRTNKRNSTSRKNAPQP